MKILIITRSVAQWWIKSGNPLFRDRQRTEEEELGILVVGFVHSKCICHICITKVVILFHCSRSPVVGNAAAH